MTSGPSAARAGTTAVRGVLLDLDDTLVDTRSAFRAAVAHVVERWLPHLTPEQTEAAALHWALDPGGHFRAYTRGESTMAEQRRLRAQDLHATFGGAALDDAAHEAWTQGYEAAFRAAWTLRPGAVELLDALADAGVPAGAVTNLGRAYQEDKLAVLGLADRVRVLACVDDLGVGKPDPRVFELACDRLGVPARECAYVGDEVDVDARGARDAGLVGVWLDSHGSGERPDDVLVARSLEDVPGLLGLAPAR